MADKTIIYESLSQSDYLPDWGDKINVIANSLKESILSIYNNLHIDTDAKTIGGTAYDEAINGVNSEIFNVYSKNSDGGIFFHSLNNGNVSNRVAYIKETETGNFEARFNNLILDESLSVEGDFTLGSEGSENSLNVVGPAQISGNFSLKPTFVNVDSLEQNVLKVSGISSNIFFLNFSDENTSDITSTINFLDDVVTPAQKFPIKQGTTFRFIAGQLNNKNLKINFSNADIVNSDQTEFDLGSSDYGKELEVLIVGDAIGTANSYKIYVTLK